MVERIRLLRNQRKFTQSKLGEIFGIDGKRISYYENGTHVPSADVLVKRVISMAINEDKIKRMVS